MKNRSYLAFWGGQRYERLGGEEKAINCGCKSHEVKFYLCDVLISQSCRMENYNNINGVAICSSKPIYL